MTRYNIYGELENYRSDTNFSEFDDNYCEHYTCAECGDEIADYYWHAEDIDRAFGKEVIFCSKSCLKKFRESELCAECGEKLPEKFIYNKRYGKNVRFCSDYCYNKYFGL